MQRIVNLKKIGVNQTQIIIHNQPLKKSPANPRAFFIAIIFLFPV